MAGSENILAAPTEGLGQTVTFAFRPVDYGAASSGSASTLRGELQESGRNSPSMTTNGPVHPADTSLTNVLIGLIDQSGREAMKKAQTEAFLTGMQRAAAGEAVADIAKNQPWYSKLFGDSDVVEGARSYTGVAVANSVVNALEDSMPDLRKLDAAAAKARMSEQITQAMTGDAASDMAIMQHMSAALPSLMRRHVKEHYGYMQETATAAEKAAFDSWADRLQAASRGLTNGTTNPDEFKAIIQGFKLGVLPANGRDPSNYAESMADNLTRWALGGKLHALNALKESGFMEVLTADQQSRVENAVERGENKLRIRYSADNIDELAKLRERAEYPAAGDNTATLAADIDKFNKAWKDSTGSRTPFIGPEHKAAMLSGNAVAIRRALDADQRAARVRVEALEKAGDKARADASRKDSIAIAITTGDAGVAAATWGPETDQAFSAQFASFPPGSPERLALLVRNARSNYTNKFVKAQIIGGVKAAISEADPAAMLPILKDYTELAAVNSEVAADYYGEYAPKLEGLRRDIAIGLAPNGAYREWFTRDRRAQLSDKEMVDGIAAVVKDHNSWLPQWAGGEPDLKPGQARRIMNRIGDSAQRWAAATNGDFKEAVKKAWRSAKGEGLEVIGGYAWENDGQPSLEQYLTTRALNSEGKPLSTSKLHDVVGNAIEWALYGEKSLGENGVMSHRASDISIWRQKDKDGVPRFVLQAVNDGVVYTQVVSGNDIVTMNDAYEKARKDKARKLHGRSGMPSTSK